MAGSDTKSMLALLFTVCFHALGDRIWILQQLCEIGELQKCGLPKAN